VVFILLNTAIRMGLLWITVLLVLGIISLLRYLASQDANYFKSKGNHYPGNSTYRMLTLSLERKMCLLTMRDHESGKRYVSYLEQESTLHEGGGGVEIEMEDAYSKLSMDIIIAAVACGIDKKAFESREPPLFHRMGNKLKFQLAGIALIRFIFIAF
jgi:hypothetical protein